MKRTAIVTSTSRLYRDAGALLVKKGRPKLEVATKRLWCGTETKTETPPGVKYKER